ncbi:unnamed protein product, partial [Darwinula stevensoni]
MDQATGLAVVALIWMVLQMKFVFKGQEFPDNCHSLENHLGQERPRQIQESSKKHREMEEQIFSQDTDSSETKVSLHHVVELNNSGNLAELRKRLSRTPSSRLFRMLDEAISRAAKSLNQAVAAILKCSPESSDAIFSSKGEIYLHLMRMLQGDDLQTKVSTDLKWVLSNSIDYFSVNGAVEISQAIMTDIKDGRDYRGGSFIHWSSIKEKLVTLSTKKSSSLKGISVEEKFNVVLGAIEEKANGESISFDHNTMSSSAYKAHVINTICNLRWDLHCVPFIAAMFVDMPMSPEEAGFVITKLFKAVVELPVVDAPPVVHHMLRLCKHHHRGYLLTKLSDHFGNLFEQCRKEDSQDL